MSRYSRLAGRMRGPPTLAPSLALTLALALARPQYDVLPKAKGALDTVTTAASNLDANYGITSKIDEQLKLSQVTSLPPHPRAHPTPHPHASRARSNSRSSSRSSQLAARSSPSPSPSPSPQAVESATSKLDEVKSSLTAKVDDLKSKASN